MRFDFRLAMLGVFVVLLLGLATTWTRAQPAYAERRVPPVVLAGPDVGFRMTGVKGDTPVGQLVIRVKGEWKVVEFGTSPVPLGK
jgi:hypothetical protein